jgi:predicted Zn-dependent peptidase
VWNSKFYVTFAKLKKRIYNYLKKIHSMKRIIILTLIIVAVIFTSCNKSKTRTATDANGYKYEYVEDDPTGARIYTLSNGLKVYLAVNKDEPKIQTYIAVRAGSKNDPVETTGLAHYFEHMMFKGTSKIGTLDWEKESALIAQISDLFEQRAKTNDQAEKDRIYAQIDSLSLEASKYAVPSEYDKICSMLGAQGTNAWTSTEETVYENEIPSNEVERFLYVERERFENIVLRLFHTELETVYEEFNMGQDRDGTKSYYALSGELFKKHPYGRKVIGIAEHLKNPSMVNIMNFKAQYYVPNNMAICMSGDLDMEETVKLVDKYWGSMEPNKNLPKFEAPKEDPRTEITKIDVVGPDREWIILGWRTPGNAGEDEDYLDMISEILSNGTAGLIDLDLIKNQKVMSAYAYPNVQNDYGSFIMGGYPKDGQTLEEVQDLLLQEIDKIKKGEFDDWLLEAIINQQKLERIKAIENNSVSYWFVDNFISGKKWEDKVFGIEKIAKLTKKQIVDYANKNFSDNYAVVYKRTGKDPNVIKVD